MTQGRSPRSSPASGRAMEERGFAVTLAGNVDAALRGLMEAPEYAGVDLRMPGGRSGEGPQRQRRPSMSSSGPPHDTSWQALHPSSTPSYVSRDGRASKARTFAR